MFGKSFGFCPAKRFPEKNPGKRAGGARTLPSKNTFLYFFAGADIK